MNRSAISVWIDRSSPSWRMHACGPVQHRPAGQCLFGAQHRTEGGDPVDGFAQPDPAP